VATRLTCVTGKAEKTIENPVPRFAYGKPIITGVLSALRIDWKYSPLIYANGNQKLVMATYTKYTEPTDNLQERTNDASLAYNGGEIIANFAKNSTNSWVKS